MIRLQQQGYVSIGATHTTGALRPCRPLHPPSSDQPVLETSFLEAVVQIQCLVGEVDCIHMLRAFAMGREDAGAGAPAASVEHGGTRSTAVWETKTRPRFYRRPINENAGTRNARSCDHHGLFVNPLRLAVSI